MATVGTKRVGTATVLSSQASVYKRADGAGYVITGPAISTTTNIALDIVSRGNVRNFQSYTGYPTISSINYLDQNNAPSSGVAVSTSVGGNLRITGNAFSDTDSVYFNNTKVTSVYGNTTTIYATIPAGIVGNVIIGVFNTANVGTLANTLIRYSGSPVWGMDSSITVYRGINANITLRATSDSTVTYNLKSGSGTLPSSMSLLSAGYLTGATDAAAGSSSTFTLIATDAEGQSAQKSFTVTVASGDSYFKQTTLLINADTSTPFLKDASDNNYRLTRFGDLHPVKFSPFIPTGSSAFFNGSTGYLLPPVNSNLSLAADFTIEMWVYGLNSAGRGTGPILLGRNAAYTATNNVYICYRHSNASNVISLHRSPSSPLLSGTTTISDNTWYHIAVTRSGSTVRMFVNGTLEGNTLEDANTWDYSNPTIGSNPSDAAGVAATAFGGYISNLRIIPGIALYTSSFTAPTKGLPAIQSNKIAELLMLRDNDFIADPRSSNSVVVTRTGEVRYSSFSPFNSTPYTVTTLGHSVYFDGTGDYLAVDDYDTLSFSNQPFTIEAWVSPYALGANRRILSQRDSQQYELYLRQESTNFIRFFCNVNNSTLANVVTSTAVTGNTWQHIAVVRTNNTATATSTINIFINGLIRGTANYNSSLNLLSDSLTANITIGSNIGVGEFYSGSISNLRVSTVALYTANFTPTTSALTANASTRLLTCASQTLEDKSNNAFPVYWFNDAKLSNASPFGDTTTSISNYTYSADTYGASGYFDGTTDYLSIPAAPISTTGDFCVETWIWCADTTNRTIFFLRGQTNSYAGLRLDTHNAANNFLLLHSTSGSTWAVNTGYTPGVSLFNRWVHVAVVRQTNTVYLYVDGQRAITATFGTMIAGTQNHIGAGESGARSFYGYMSNFRVINGYSYYPNPFRPPAAPLGIVSDYFYGWNTQVLTLQKDVGVSSSLFHDESYANHPLVRTNTPAGGSFVPAAPTAWSAYFDGTGDYLTAANSSVFGFGTANFTVEGWFYFTSNVALNQRQRLWSFGDDNDGVDVLSGNLRLAGNVQGNLITGTTAISSNQWYHVALVRNTGNYRIYLNGTQYGSTVANSYSSSSRLVTLMATSTGANITAGYVSNFRITDSAVYTANFTPSVYSLTSINKTSLLIFNNAVMEDNSPYNIALTPAGDTKMRTFGPMAPHTVTPRGSSILFDSLTTYITVPDNVAFELGSTSAWTIEMWVYPLSFTGNPSLVQKGFTATDDHEYTISLTSNGNVSFLYSNIGGGTIDGNITSSSNISLESWSHIGVKRDGSTGYIFINGTFTDSFSTSSLSMNTETGALGIGGGPTGQNIFYGLMSNFRIVKNEALYNSPSTYVVPIENLSSTSNTVLLIGHTTSIVDGSSNAFTLTGNSKLRMTSINPFGYDYDVGVYYQPDVHGSSIIIDSTKQLNTRTDVTSLAREVIGGWIASSTNLTIESWIYLTSYSGQIYGVLIGAMQGAAGTNDWSFGVRSDTYKVVFYWWTGAGNFATGDETVPLYSWSHIAITISNGTIKLYLNGRQQVITGTSTITTSATETLSYLYMGSFSSVAMSGYVSNLRITRSAVYNNSFLPQAQPFIRSTSPGSSFLLNGMTYNSLYDATCRNNLEIVGEVRISDQNQANGTGGLWFDGAGDYLRAQTSPDFQFGRGDFTIEFYVYFNTIATVNRHLVDPRNAANQALPLIYMHFSTATIRYFVSNADRITSGTIAANTWYHIAVAREGTNTKMFIDGYQNGVTWTDTTDYIQPPAFMNFGYQPTTSTGFIDGYMDDIRITKGYARYTADFYYGQGGFPVV